MNDYQQNSNLPSVKKLVIVSDEDFGQKDAYVRQINFASKMCSISYSQDVTGNGILYVGSIAASLPRLNPDFQNFILLNGEKRWVCLAEDFNGYTHIIGTAGTGCQLRFTGSSGPNNGYELQLTGSNPEPFQIKNAKIMDCLTERMVVDIRKSAKVDYYMAKGQTLSEEITLYDINGDAIDLTGSSFDLKIYQNEKLVKTYRSYNVEGQNAELIIANDNLSFSFSGEVELNAGNYTYQLWQTYANLETEPVMDGLWYVN